MLNIKLSWECDVSATSYSVYKSEEPINPNTLPAPLVTNLLQKTFIDSEIVSDIIYYYRVVSIHNNKTYISDEIVASITSQNLFIFNLNENYTPPAPLAVNFTIEG